jgi:hypothetical protein
MFAVGAGASRVLAAAEFWNARASSTWTDEEVGALISKSPWAKAAIPTMKAAKGEDPVSDPAARGGRGFRLTPITVTVRWESAQPILDALKSPLAADFEGHYVVSVTNLPMENARRTGRGADTTPDDALERLQAGAILQLRVKNRLRRASSGARALDRSFSDFRRIICGWPRGIGKLYLSWIPDS